MWWKSRTNKRLRFKIENLERDSKFSQEKMINRECNRAVSTVRGNKCLSIDRGSGYMAKATLPAWRIAESIRRTATKGGDSLVYCSSRWWSRYLEYWAFLGAKSGLGSVPTLPLLAAQVSEVAFASSAVLNCCELSWQLLVLWRTIALPRLLFFYCLYYQSTFPCRHGGLLYVTPEDV